MQKKWWTKTRTILCSGLVITMLSATGALAVVACGEKNKDIPKVLHNRPVRGFYFRYEEKDYPRMKEVIRYVYDNNHLKKLYEKKGYYWPEITKISDPEIITRPYDDSDIDEDVFNRNYELSLERYQPYYRNFWFDLEFEKTDSNPLAPSPKGSVSIRDWLYAYDSAKYERTDDLWPWMKEDGFRNGRLWFNAVIWNLAGSDEKEGWWNAPNKVYDPGYFSQFSMNIFPNWANRGSHAVDLWYIINQWEPTWPKHWKDYLDDMLNLYKDENLERFLPVKEA